jgi:hypothetical protein
MSPGPVVVGPSCRRALYVTRPFCRGPYVEAFLVGPFVEALMSQIPKYVYDAYAGVVLTHRWAKSLDHQNQ